MKQQIYPTTKEMPYLELIGAVIGLLRAADGKEIEASVRDLVLAALGAYHRGDSSRVPDLLTEVRAERHRLVPDCATCSKPCGRTSEYDLGNIPSTSAKWELLDACGELADAILSKQHMDADTLMTLYRGIFQIGEYIDEDTVAELIQETKQAVK